MVNERQCLNKLEEVTGEISEEESALVRLDRKILTHQDTYSDASTRTGYRSTFPSFGKMVKLYSDSGLTKEEAKNRIRKNAIDAIRNPPKYHNGNDFLKVCCYLRNTGAGDKAKDHTDSWIRFNSNRCWSDHDTYILNGDFVDHLSDQNREKYSLLIIDSLVRANREWGVLNIARKLQGESKRIGLVKFCKLRIKNIRRYEYPNASDDERDTEYLVNRAFQSFEKVFDIIKKNGLVNDPQLREDIDKYLWWICQ